MNIIIAPDSFKGSLSTTQVADHIKAGVLRVFPTARIQILPMADGGEGTVEAMVTSLSGHYEAVTVTGPMGTPVEARFGILEDGKAVLEMAAASGLPLVPADQKDICKATTYGTGELLKKAMDLGCKKIYIGIGGSATNDGGIGMAQALGAHFLDEKGQEVGFGGGALSDIRSINLSGMDSRLKETEITVMCDVDNPLCGPKGASAIYGPQKGATPELVALLDQGLAHLVEVMKEHGLPDLKDMPGSGAAGGLGMGLAAFTGATLRSGIEAVLDAANFTEKLSWAHLVITGEGRIDGQSIFGKVPTGISKYAVKYKVPVIAVVGCIGEGAKAVYEHGINTIESCVYAPSTLEEALAHAAENVENAAERVMRAVEIGMMI